MNKNNLVVPDRKKLPYGGAEAIVSTEFVSLVDDLSKNAISQKCLQDVTIQDRFTKKYKEWILSSKINQVIGLDQYTVTAYSNGTTEGFDKFYLKHHTRRFRCLRGEYMYHMAAWKTYFPNWEYIDDAPLAANDAVVISFPFADIGQEHSRTEEILDACAKLNIPVLIDCAYFGICGNMTFNFSHPAITDITFSLSKFLPVPHLRIGVRFTKIDDDDSLLVNNKSLYTNRLGSAVGIAIMDVFDPDYMYNTYRSAQLILCDKLKIVPSKSVIFGIDHNNLYPEYNRNGISNRLCLAKHLSNSVS
jgi:hypothetical protein